MKLCKLAMFCALALAAVTPASALDFTKPLTQVSGEAFNDATGKPVVTTLQTVAQAALQISEPNMAPGEKASRYWFAQRIQLDPKNVIITPEETLLLKRVIDSNFGPAIVGQAWAILDPTTIPKK